MEARERRISGDVRKKAQKLDERLPPTLRGDGEKGPVERRLDELGTVFGIAFGLLLAGERPEPWTAAGLVLVLASLWAVVVRSPASPDDGLRSATERGSVASPDGMPSPWGDGGHRR